MAPLTFLSTVDQPTAETVVASPENDDLPKVTPDGLWIIYLTYPKDTYILHAERRIWRIPLAGGPAVPIMAAHAGATVRCTRSGAIPCVLNERGTDGKQLLFYAFDPLRGKGRELARMDSRFASYFPWNVSPDGSYVALAVPGERTGHIRLLPLAGGVVQDVIVNNSRGFQSISWASDGKGWYVSSYMPLSSTLLYIDLQGHAQPLRENVEWAVPSPNGRHLALLEWSTASNAWMIENF